ncbi:hypothetical protein [Dysgonomonas sp. 511]|uniref:hypothetical protein n=1 Tax=Dysgonomonas sp. 511 TaxID=2302930 RepID=UPI0013D0C805|nr:hypothetical protein [Dysgonomonas sp. 511]
MAKKSDKSKELFGLDKIPDHILNKRLLVERGQRESYIQELEEENKDLKTRLSKYEKVK